MLGQWGVLRHPSPWRIQPSHELIHHPPRSAFIILLVGNQLQPKHCPVFSPGPALTFGSEQSQTTSPSIRDEFSDRATPCTQLGFGSQLAAGSWFYEALPFLVMSSRRMLGRTGTTTLNATWGHASNHQQPQLMGATPQGLWAKSCRMSPAGGGGRSSACLQTTNTLIPPAVFNSWKMRPSNSGPSGKAGPRTRCSLHRHTLSPCNQFWQIKSFSGSLGPNTRNKEETWGAARTRGKAGFHADPKQPGLGRVMHRSTGGWRAPDTILLRLQQQHAPLAPVLIPQDNQNLVMDNHLPREM